MNARPTFFFTAFGESVVYIVAPSSDEDILSPPFRPGNILQYSMLGLGYPSPGAASLATLKWGSWSMPQGIRHGTCLPDISDARNAGAACIAV